MAFHGLEHITDLNPDDFTDVRWRTIARAAVNVHNAGKVANHLTINDEIEARGWDKALAKEFLVGNWKEWRDIADASLALTKGGLSIRECVKDLRYYAQKRREQEILKRAVEGELTGEQTIEALIKNRPAPLESELFVDLATLINSGLQPERPTVAQVLPSRGLLYAGRLNEIHSEPGLGKTNISLGICKSVIQEGGRVLFIDPEDCASGILRRLASFGADTFSIVERFHYLHNPTPEEFNRAISWAERNKPNLVCLDGLAEALAAELLDENSVSDVLSFFRQRLRPFADLGAAVLIADHVSKAAEGRGRWARGSGAKLGRYDGVSYEAELVEPYSPTIAGKVRLRVSKDRNGGAGVSGQVVAEIHFTPSPACDDTTVVEFREPTESGKQFKPTVIMAKICEHLEIFPDATRNDLRELGKHDWVDKAIKQLVSDGFMSVTKHGQRMKFYAP